MPQIATIINYNSILDDLYLSLPKEVSYLKIKATVEQSVKWFQVSLPNKKVIFSIPKKDNPKRSFWLEKAARTFDYVELFAPFDLENGMYLKIPPAKRMLKWEGSVTSVNQLKEIYATLQSYQAAHYELVTLPNHAADLLIPLQLQKEESATNLSCYASGNSGMWTQIVSSYFGAAIIYGELDNNLHAYFSIQKLISDYKLPYLKAFKFVYGIIGHPVLNSFSPKMHNGGYNSLDIPALYLPFQVKDFADFWKNIINNPATQGLGIMIKGLTCVSPFKNLGIEFVDQIDSSIVQNARAGNLLINSGKTWIARTTDSLGIIDGLKRRNINISDLNAAIVGCGGAGRSIAYALHQAGAKVTLVNRSTKRGLFASKTLNLPFQLLADFRASDFNLVVNATPVGKNNRVCPFNISSMKPSSVVVDMVYSKTSTHLIKTAQSMGLIYMDGFEILRTQVKYQFTGMTGVEMPDEMAFQLAQPERNFINF